MKGDGLTLYEKYRGVAVIKSRAGSVFTRLSPNEKVHFVLDPSNVLDLDSWYRSTGIPVVLFDFRPGIGRTRNNYDVTSDGQRFLIISPTQDETTSSITITLNWSALLKK